MVYSGFHPANPVKEPLLNFFDIAAVLVTLAALFGYVNYRLLKLPATTGILALALLSSILMLLSSWLSPAFISGNPSRHSFPASTSTISS